jgi:hypothetical protein
MKTQNESIEGRTFYAVVLETISSPEFTCTDDNGNPWLFRSEKDAWKDIADSMIMGLTEFIEGRRGFHETDFQTDMHVIAVTIADGRIVGESDGYDLVHEIVKGTEINFEGTEGT